MASGYKPGSIRSGTKLTDEQWNQVLLCMTGAVTVRGLMEGCGLKHITAENVRYKVMYAIAEYQAGIKFENHAVLSYSGIKTSEKGANECVLDSKPRLQAVFATDSAGQSIGMAGNHDSVVSGYSPDGTRSVNVDDSVNDWLVQHGISMCIVQSDGTRITESWNRFIAHFKGINTKYLRLYIAWFCYLWNAKVAGKAKEDIACELWKLVNNTERTVGYRRFRNVKYSG